MSDPASLIFVLCASWKHFHLPLFSQFLFSQPCTCKISDQYPQFHPSLCVFFSCWTLVEECEHMSPVAWSKVDLLLLCVDQTVMWERSWTGQILTQLDTHTHTAPIVSWRFTCIKTVRGWPDWQECACLCLTRRNPDKQEVRPGQIWGLLNPIYWHETSWLFQFHFYICHSFVSLPLQPRGQDHLRVWRRPLVTEELTPLEKRLTKRSACSQMCHLITEEGRERNWARKEEQTKGRSWKGKRGYRERRAEIMMMSN